MQRARSRSGRLAAAQCHSVRTRITKVFCAGVVRLELDSSFIAAGRRWGSCSMERHYEVLIPHGS